MLKSGGKVNHLSTGDMLGQKITISVDGDNKNLKNFRI